MPVENSIAFTRLPIFSFFTRPYTTTPKILGQILRILIPQEPKPMVSNTPKVDTLLGVPLKTPNSARQARPTRPIFRKVAA